MRMRPAGDLRLRPRPALPERLFNRGRRVMIDFAVVHLRSMLTLIFGMLVVIAEG